MKTSFTRYLRALQAGTMVLLLWLSMISNSSATHIAGAEITYQWVSGNTYIVKLDYYRDCSGIPVPSLQLNYISFTCGMGPYNAAMTSTGTPVTITPICPASAANSSCNGGSLYAVEKLSFVATITLPANCSDWIFYYEECCRNGAITNLTNSSTSGSYISSRLNNLDFPFNNSVQFGQIPVNIIPNAVTTTMGWTAYDSDGDSLFYELTPAREYNGGPQFLTYASGLGYQQPFTASAATSLNNTNGLLTVTPSANQVAVVCMKVSEFRNGIFAGSVNRDFQIAVISSANNSPSLTGINGTTNFITNGCPGDTISFDVFSNDPDAGQTLTIEMSNIGTGASFTSTPGTNPTGTFAWIPVTGDISNAPYLFDISVNDDFCDYYGSQSYIYQVYVNGCNTNDVWPGDANADGDANLYDLLPIGIAYNDNGPVRPSASLNWTAQPCPDWTNDFVSGINHKHADTNGDGIINITDTTAVFQNYGLNHPLRTGNPNTLTVADLLITASDDTVGLIHTVNFDIAFATPVDSIYGLAFRLYFDPALIDLNSVSVSYPGSVFGTNAVDMIKIDRSQGMNGFVDIALTRINQLNITGTGPVARVTIVTTDNVSGKVTLTVTPFDIVGISLSESDVQLNGIGDGVTIDPNFVGFNEVNLSQLVQVYPSPAHDYINFNFSGTQKVDFIRLYDVAGKEVLSVVNPASDTAIDINTLSKGTYLLKAAIGGSNIYKKIMVF